MNQGVRMTKTEIEQRTLSKLVAREMCRHIPGKVIELNREIADLQLKALGKK